MNASLTGVGNILDNLVITSPIAGQLATPQQLEIGQAINPGQRYGQVDILDEFKVRVAIDELYLQKCSTKTCTSKKMHSHMNCKTCLGYRTLNIIQICTCQRTGAHTD